jgi:hypothetical protein
LEAAPSAEAEAWATLLFSPGKTTVFVTSNLFGASYVFGWEVKKTESPAAVDTEGRGFRPGLLIYVAMTAGAAVTADLRRRMAAEMRVMRRPTGRGSMKV